MPVGSFRRALARRLRIGIVVTSAGDTSGPANSGAALIVPRLNESVLAHPPRKDWPAVAAENSRRLQAAVVDLFGVSLGQLRTQTQAAVIARAAEYTSRLVGESVTAAPIAPLIVTGHQPELFHAGVWAKNFAAAGLAKLAGGLAINLLIDNDIIGSSQILVPVGTRQTPAVEWMPFDQIPPQPWEECRLVDPDCFRTFGTRVSRRIRDCWGYDPLLSHCWPEAVRQADRASGLTDCLAAVRANVERSHGLRNLEIPMSCVCQLPSFYWFASLVLGDLPRFHAVYNAAIGQFRRDHGIRSQTHPVPNLAIEGEWYEAPFWVWRKGAAKRERPMVRQTDSCIEVRDGQGVLVRLPCSSSQSLDDAAAELGQLNGRGIRFRTRALTTTLFVRLFLADLFIHGIGGANYDVMTDRICRQFLGIEPPLFATVSATLHLPLGTGFPASTEGLRAVEQRIRELHYNPDRFVADRDDPAIVRLAGEKRQLIGDLRGRRPTRLEHLRLSRINADIFAALPDDNRSLREESRRLRAELRANSLLQNREFSWCLHREDQVTPFLAREFLP